MFANVTIHSTPHKQLAISNEAIIFTSTGKRVIKRVGKQRYQPITIKTGIKSQGKTEILAGLKAGDRIVISSQFLLDSESNLQASFNRLSE
jgi:Cu(I)/Ag(I) efflux system membrane fusion protein